MRTPGAPDVAAGDFVWARQERWRVVRARRDAEVVRLDLTGRRGAMTLLTPFDRVQADAPGPRRWRRRRPAHLFARMKATLARAVHARSLPSLVGADATILPYQLEPALALAAGARRILVADEVGLGKTLQALIAIADLVGRDPDARVLVLTPASLCRQWSDELTRRFAIAHRQGDREGLDQAARESAFGENVWRRSGVWIATLDFLKQPHILEALPLLPWDLVVIDEAHDACGYSDRHGAAQAIARQARRLLLLTATPHSGDDQRFDRLMRLGQLTGGDDEIRVFRRTRADLGSTPNRTVRWRRVRLSAAEDRVLDTLLRFERAVLGTASERSAGALLLLAVFRKRALSTMSALAVSLDRRLAWLEGDREGEQPEWQQLTLLPADDVVAEEDDRALRGESGLDPAQERRWLRRLQGLTVAASAEERKIAWLTCRLARSREPVIVFTEFRHSLEVVERRLSTVRRVAVIHGGQSAPEREQALDAFRDGRASVLVATDVAGQGLNLQQRARWVVNLELPWNPAKLEQRAGRVDRIGQRRRVHVTLLVAEHAAESDLLEGLARRRLAADDALGEPAIALCRRWRRHASAIARDLIWRRALKTSPAAVEREMSWTPIARVPALRPFQASIFIFEISILDGASAIVESRVVPVRVDGDSRLDVQAAVDRALKIVVNRVARLERAYRRRDECAVAIEVRLHDELRTRVAAGELQPGLFDERAVRMAEATRETEAELDADLAARLVRIRSAAGLRAGHPVLVGVFAARHV